MLPGCPCIIVLIIVISLPIVSIVKNTDIVSTYVTVNISIILLVIVIVIVIITVSAILAAFDNVSLRYRQ